MFVKFLFPLLAPESVSGPVGSNASPIPSSNSGSGGKEIDGPGSAEDDLRTLREGDTTPEVEEDEEVEPDDEPIVKDEEDEEPDTDKTTDDEEDEEDETETKEPADALITAKDLKAKYPDIFKKFPELKGAIYRDQQYSQIFADPREAQAAAQASETFQEMSNDLLSGDVAPLINAIKKSGDDSYTKFVSNILPALEKSDEATFMRVLEPQFKRLLRSAYATATKKGDKNLAASAQHIHNFIFENFDLQEKAAFETEARKKTPEQERWERKTQELERRDYTTAKYGVDNSWIQGVQDEFLRDLDPNNTLGKWTRDKLVESAVIELNRQMTGDTRFQKQMSMLWKQAQASGYDNASKSRIVNTALARAKQMIPELRGKLKREALGKATRKIEEKTKMRGAPRTEEQRKVSSRKNPKSTSSMSELDVIRGL